MRDNDGRKLDHSTLEAIRIRAVDQIKQGAHPEEVAKVLGMSRSAVYGWVAKDAAGGREALLAKPVPGRPTRLDEAQTRRVFEIVVGTNPDQAAFDFGLWTRQLVREVIRREFGIDLSVWSVGRLLHRLGLSPQRPLYRAYQADPAKVQEWKDTRYPEIVKQAKKNGAIVYFADEASIRSDYHAGTTWAPVGQTPVVTSTGARFSVNMISAVTARGEMKFQILKSTLTAAVFIDFCKRLLKDSGGRKVVLIVDGHPVHRAKAVADWVASTNGMFTLERLPGYSPQLNPDEQVWKNVKHDRVGRRMVTGPDQFKALCVSALHRLQKLPHIIQGFFHHPDLAYIHLADATA